MNLREEERRARLLKSRAERLPDIKKQFEEAQNRNFNSNFQPGGKDADLVGANGSKGKKAPKTAKKASSGKTGSKKSPEKRNGASPENAFSGCQRAGHSAHHRSAG